MISMKLISIAFLLFADRLCAIYARDSAKDGSNLKIYAHKKVGIEKTNRSDSRHLPFHNSTMKYSSRITGSRYSSNLPVFENENFFFGKINSTNNNLGVKNILSSTEKVLDFRIGDSKKSFQVYKSGDDENKNDLNSDDGRNDENYLDADDLVKASAGGGKQKKEAVDEEEKTLAQQVADGKYGLIQNELFSNGSSRPGILSYKSNKEVPKDTKENLGGLDKNEIWLAEDHILVLRGGNYQRKNNNETTQASLEWAPIDNYIAPRRQVKIPENPIIPPPFPIQLADDGPVEFIKGQNNPLFLPPVLPPIPPFIHDSNKTIPLPFTVFPISPGSDNKNKTFPLSLPPFLSNLPPGATFKTPPDNNTEIDEDDPSIYYPPKYDFYYPTDNTTSVSPGPLVPGIILPPPPDFFSLLKSEKSNDGQKETDDRTNSITPNPFNGPKYLPALRKPVKTRPIGNIIAKKFNANITDSNNSSHPIKSEKSSVTYVYPDNSKSKLVTTTTPTYGTLNISNKINSSKFADGFNSPIFVPNDPDLPFYHPLPTTSPKPNHITLPPTTKSLPKHILIITTPHSTNNHKKLKNIYGSNKNKELESNLSNISPEIHPLRSLIKPNVSVTYNGKYGHLPTPGESQSSKPDEGLTIIRGHYATQPPLTKGSKVPSTDVNSITVTPVPVVKKVRLQPDSIKKPEISPLSQNPTKATLYFYEETSSKEELPKVSQTNEPEESVPKSPSISNIQAEVKPMTSFYYTTHSTSKTPIRQFLEETFHSSNVLPRKPQLSPINNAETITHNGYSEIPKMKHLNYGTPIPSQRPMIKYHYVTDGNAVVIPTPNIKDLEIKNSGSSGLQKINFDPHSIRSAPKPIMVEHYDQRVQKPKESSQMSVPQIVTPGPIEYSTAEEPFIPSNYYATLRPEHVHLTSQEQTLVDDITKNYFTIFGQKLNSPSTTPLIPMEPTSTKTNTKPPESGLAYISEDGKNFKIQQVHEKPGRKPSKSNLSYHVRENFKKQQPIRPQSNFEKYLKELTGEDQRDYIVTGVFPVKIKKGKGISSNGIPAHFFQQHPFILPNGGTTFLGTGAQLPYQTTPSTTIRPITNVELKPQQIPSISSIKPYSIYQPAVQSQSVAFSPQFQQYLRELTGLTNPTAIGPTKVHTNQEYAQNPTIKASYKITDYRQKPSSLENDVLINFKAPRPEIEPSAEIVNIPGQAPYDNIKIVDSPDLSGNANIPYSPITFDVNNVFLQNIKKPDYFAQTHSSGGNAFISYNLPGNGGHFYFLTPQIAERTTEPENRGLEKTFKRINRSHAGPNQKSSDIKTDSGSDQIQDDGDSGYTNSDYVRRRRKRP